MRVLGKTLVIAVLMASFTALSYASDWDVAGKVLTGIEGMRIITGGKVDIIGTMTGIKNNREHKDRSCNKKEVIYVKERSCTDYVWVPHFTWRKKYIPQHREYDQEYGEIIVEGHYISYKVEDGGSWVHKGSYGECRGFDCEREPCRR
jgi:hypothetical protein